MIQRFGTGSAVALVVLAALVGGCSSGPVNGEPAAVPSGTWAAPLPMPSTQMPPPTPEPSDSNCENSLRAMSPMPAPGHMPAGSTMQQIWQRGVLLAGVDQDSYNWGFPNPSPTVFASPSPSTADGQHYAGFDVDMLHVLAWSIFGDPNRIQFVPVSQEFRMGAAEQGIVDVVANSITSLCSRKEQVQFSANYLQAGQALLVPAGNPHGVTVEVGNNATTLTNLGKVCTVGTTTSVANLTKLQENQGFEVVTAGNWSDCLVLLQQDQVDAISTDDTILGGILAQAPYLTLIKREFSQEPHGLAFPKFMGTAPPSARNQDPDNTGFVRFANGVIRDLEDSKSKKYCPELRLSGESCWSAMYRKWVAPQLGAPGSASTDVPGPAYQTYSPPPTTPSP